MRHHQHAAQGLVAGAGDRSEPGFAGCRVILWVSPIHAAKYRPDRKACGWPTFMTSSEAPIGPMPGIFAKRRLGSFWRCQAISLVSIAFSCACNWAYSLAWSTNSSRANAGSVGSACRRASNGSFLSTPRAAISPNSAA